MTKLIESDFSFFFLVNYYFISGVFFYTVLKYIPQTQLLQKCLVYNSLICCASSLWTNNEVSLKFRKLSDGGENKTLSGGMKVQGNWIRPHKWDNLFCGRKGSWEISGILYLPGGLSRNFCEQLLIRFSLLIFQTALGRAASNSRPYCCYIIAFTFIISTKYLCPALS